MHKSVVTTNTIPVNIKHLYNTCAMSDQRRRRWPDVVQMFCVCWDINFSKHTLQQRHCGPRKRCKPLLQCVLLQNHLSNVQ